MSEVTSYHVTGDWRHIVDDGMVDTDALPDEALPTGHVKFTPLGPPLAVAGDPATAYTVGPVTALIAGGTLTDMQGRDGVWLAASVGDQTVRWRAATTLTVQDQKITYPPVTFEMDGDTRITSVSLTDAPDLPPLVVDQTFRALVQDARSAKKASREAAGDAARSAANALEYQQNPRQASDTETGAVRLAGNLSGTADAPTVTTEVDGEAVLLDEFATSTKSSIDDGKTKSTSLAGRLDAIEDPDSGKADLVAGFVDKMHLFGAAGSGSPFRIDRSVGTRVFVRDDSGDEVMIYGDTGWRDVTGVMLNGWTASVFRIRRAGDVVFIETQGLVATAATTDTMYTLPVGFRMGSSSRWVNSVVQMSTNLNHVARWAVVGGSGGSFVQCNRSALNRPATGFMILASTDPWPSSLPGIAP